jgi:alkylation response protein AidB-like acyl-CoA dehydrogenase
MRLGDDDLLVAEGRALLRELLEPPWSARPDSLLVAFGALGDAGWLHGMLGEELGGAKLSCGVVTSLAAQSGALVVVDEFVNNVVLLPLLLSSIDDVTTRLEFLERHNQRPGFVVADGRGRSIISDPQRTAWVYGANPGFDLYFVARSGTGGQIRLTRITGANIAVANVGGLAPALGAVTVEGGIAKETMISVTEAWCDRIFGVSALVHSAGLVGLAREALGRTTEYAKARAQFGQPIGRFQSIKHLLADVHVLVEVARLGIVYAAEVDDLVEYEVARAKAIDAAVEATKAMVQVFGGIGFTWEHEAHWFLKTALSGSARFGGTRWSEEYVGRSVLASRATNQ